MRWFLKYHTEVSPQSAIGLTVFQPCGFSDNTYFSTWESSPTCIFMIMFFGYVYCLSLMLYFAFSRVKNKPCYNFISSLAYNTWTTLAILRLYFGCLLILYLNLTISSMTSSWWTRAAVIQAQQFVLAKQLLGIGQFYRQIAHRLSQLLFPQICHSTILSHVRLMGQFIQTVLY